MSNVGVQVQEEFVTVRAKLCEDRRDELGRRTVRRQWHSGGGSDLSERDGDASVQRQAAREVDRRQGERPRRRRGDRRRRRERHRSDSSGSASPAESAAQTGDRAERARELDQLRTELGESRAHVAELQSSLSEAARQAEDRQDQMEARVGHLTRQLAKLQLSRQLASHGTANSATPSTRHDASGYYRRPPVHAGPGAAPDPHLSVTEEEELTEGGMVTTPRRVQSEVRLPRGQPAPEEGPGLTTPAPAPRRSQSEEVKLHRSGGNQRRGGGGPRRAHCSRKVFVEPVFPDWRLAEASDADPPPTDRSEPTSCSEPPQAEARRLQALELAHAEATLRLTQEQERSARLERQAQERQRRPEPVPRVSSGLESALLAQLRRLQETVGQEQERRGLLELELERLSAGGDANTRRLSRQLERLMAELRRRPPAGVQPTQTDLRRMIETEVSRRWETFIHTAHWLSD